MAKLLKALAKNIRAYRGTRTQADFARFLGVKVSLLRRMEQGKNLPRPTQVEEIARILKIEETDLFYPGEPPKPLPAPEHDIMECHRRIGERLEAAERPMTQAEAEHAALEKFVKAHRAEGSPKKPKR